MLEAVAGLGGAGIRGAGIGTAGTASIAGCFGVGRGSDDGDDGSGATADGGDPAFGADSPPSLPTVEDPPGVVYVPSHREGVEPLGTVTAGPYRLRPMLSYAHPFWIVTGGTVEPVEISSDVDVHLMVAVEDAETGAVLPVDGGLSTTIRKDGQLVDDRSPWRMLSQTMGVHFGDNAPLAGDGTYDVSVALPPLDVRRTGRLAGRFESAQTATFSFDYDQPLRDRLIERIRYTDEADRGVPGAISPMDAAGSLPAADELPGTLQGAPVSDDQQLPRSHDADLAIAVVDDFLGDGTPYLLVSPRTPYNRFPLVGAALDCTVRRDGELVDGAGAELQPTVDDEAGFHYGAAIEGLESGDDVTISFVTPPSVARHQGYETAFLEMDPVEVALEGW